MNYLPEIEESLLLEGRDEGEGGLRALLWYDKIANG